MGLITFITVVKERDLIIRQELDGKIIYARASTNEAEDLLAHILRKDAQCPSCGYPF